MTHIFSAKFVDIIAPSLDDRCVSCLLKVKDLKAWKEYWRGVRVKMNISFEILSKKCPQCNEEFQSYYFDKVFCAESCRKIANAGKARNRNKNGRVC